MFIAVAIAGFIFVLRELLMFIGSYREHKKVSNCSEDYQPFVSVIIPARNEENNIRQCIESVSMCNYSNNNYEIIAVNDRSDDNTGKILNDLAENIPNLKVIHKTQTCNNPNLLGKPGALKAGIDNSLGEIIMMTDADCIVKPNWIRSIASQFCDESVGLIPSFTNIQGSRVFDKIQAVEWIYMHSMACAGLGLNQALGCFGNNLSVRKVDYQKTGGYEKIPFSVTEDLALIKSITSIGKEARYKCSEDSAVSTNPCNNFLEYIRQHRRWAIGGLDLGWRAAFFVLASISIWAGVILSLLIELPWLGIGFILLRIIGDAMIILPATIKLNKKGLIKWIAPSVLFFMIIELIIPVLIIDRRTKWKGQVFHKNMK